VPESPGFAAENGQTFGVQIVSFPEADVPAELRQQVRAAQEQAWPSSGQTPIATRSLIHDTALEPMSMLLVDSATVLAALDILSTEIRHAGESYVVGGLSTVITPVQARGRGYGGRLVSAARDVMAAGHLDLGLFTCDRPLQAFYERAGWHLLPGAVLVGGTVTAPFPSDQPGFDKVTMADFFSPRALRDQAVFHDARIALYPGETDKLW
jgi:aminoglycoside 2'-N-acetyltransferase I